MCGKLTPRRSAHVVADTTVRFIPLSAWLSAGEVQAAMCLFQLRCRTGNFGVIAAYQLADTDPESPDDPEYFGLALNLNGIWRTDLISLAGVLTNHAWIRFGLIVGTTSGVGSGEVSLTTAYRC